MWRAAAGAGADRPILRLAGLAGLGLAAGAAESLAVVLVVEVAAGRRAAGLPLAGLSAATPAGRAAMALAAVAVLALMHLASARLTAQTGARSLRGLRSKVADAYLSASWAAQSADHSGEVQELMTGCVPRVALAAEQVAGGIAAGLNALIVLAAAVVVDAWALPGAVVIAAVTAAVLVPSRRAARRYAGRTADANSDLAVEVAEAVALNREIRVFGVTGAARRRLHDRIERTSESFARAQFLYKAVPNLTRDVTVGALVVGVAAAARSGASLAAIGAVLVLLLRASSQVQTVAGTVHGLADLSANLERLDSYLGRWGGAPAPTGDARCAPSPAVELRGVHYRYPTAAATPPGGGDGRWALAGVDLRLEPGEQVGVVGATGAGKSTMAGLLLGLITPERGQVLVDGVDMATLAPGEWHRRVAWVPQDPRLVTGTVADNIRFMRPGISPDDLHAAARRAGLDVSGWPGGISRHVGPGGVALSGGERQRVALARALAGRPDLIVLDEPTSALDAVTEEAVRRSLADLAGSVTVVIIAHRQSLLASCHRVVSVSGGRLADPAVATGPA